LGFFIGSGAAFRKIGSLFLLSPPPPPHKKVNMILNPFCKSRLEGV
jgi:hypothetical protein